MKHTTSHTHLSEFLLLTPRYTGWRVSRNFFRPARFFGCLTASRTSSSENATPREPSEAGEDESKEEESSGETWYKYEEWFKVYMFYIYIYVPLKPKLEGFVVFRLR